MTVSETRGACLFGKEYSDEAMGNEIIVLKGFCKPLSSFWVSFYSFIDNMTIMVQVRGVRQQPAYAGAAPKSLDLGHPSSSSRADCSSAERPASARHRCQRWGASVLCPKAGKAE